MSTGRKPPMRPLTPAEVAACRSCDAVGRCPDDWRAPVRPGAACWFGCETPVDESLDPSWVVEYPALPFGIDTTGRS